MSQFKTLAEWLVNLARRCWDGVNFAEDWSKAKVLAQYRTRDWAAGLLELSGFYFVAYRTLDVGCAMYPSLEMAQAAFNRLCQMMARAQRRLEATEAGRAREARPGPQRGQARAQRPEPLAQEDGPEAGPDEGDEGDDILDLGE